MHKALDLEWKLSYSALVATLAPVTMDLRKPSQEALSSSVDFAFERHYYVAEIVELWGLSENIVRRIFGGEPGVLEWGQDEERFKCCYKTLPFPRA